MSKTALILIDIQQGLDELGFYGGQRNNPTAEINCGKLLDFFREKAWPIFHIKHNSTNPDSPLFPSKAGNQIKSIVAPVDGEPVIEKNVNSALIGTDLKDRLEVQAIRSLILVGLTSEHCVSSTARMASNLGFEVTVVSDATAAFDKEGVDGKRYNAEIIHQTTMATLNSEFATIATTEEILR